jgi:hypothetical protein
MNHLARLNAKKAYRYTNGFWNGHVYDSRKKVRCIETGEVFSSCIEAAKSAGCGDSWLSKVIREQRCFKGRSYEYI